MDDLARLRERLAEALQPKDDDNDTPMRAQVRKALAALNDYLRETDIELELRVPLVRLYGALEDIAQGRTNPLLEPNVMGMGTPKKRALEALQWSMAAAAVSILKDEAKWPLAQALALVSREMGFDAKQLEEFRKNLKKGRTAGDARPNYDNFLADRRRYSAIAPLDYIRILMSKGRVVEKG